MILKTKINTITAIITATLSLSALQANAALVDITNPSFESKFDGWSDTDPSAISGDALSGSRSVKITGSRGAAEQSVSIDENTNYILTAYVKGSGEVGVIVNGITYSNVGGGDDFEAVTVEFNSGSASSATIFASYGNDEGRFDDFSLESTSTVPAEEPEQEPPTPEEPSNSGTCSSNAVLSISSAFDNGTNDGHGPENTIDNDSSDTESRWSSIGSGKTITYDLGNTVAVNELSVKWFKGNSRSSFFDIDTSTDNNNWLSVLSNGSSSGGSSSFEGIDVEDSNARYVRITGFGNSSNEWNSIIETDILGCSSAQTPTEPEEDPEPIEEEPEEQPTPPISSTGSCNIDMSIWGYTIGDGVSRNNVSDIQDLIDNKNLSTDGFDELTWDNGCPTFSVKNISASSQNSSFARSELRELLAEYTDPDENVKGLTGNNWVISTASSSNQSKVGGVDGNMKATLVVNTVSVDAEKTDQVGRIIVGQIHGEDHEPVKIYYRKLPNHSKGSVFFTVDGSDGKPSDRINVIGFTDKNDTDDNASGDPVNPENGIALGDEWSYEIDLKGDKLKVTVFHNGFTYTTEDSIAYTKTRSKDLRRVSSDTDSITLSSFYRSDYMYFKAGLYNQNNTGTQSPDFASVTFKVIDVTH